MTLTFVCLGGLLFVQAAMGGVWPVWVVRTEEPITLVLTQPNRQTSQAACESRQDWIHVPLPDASGKGRQ